MIDGLKVEEVAMCLGVSYQTINRWYKFKRENPDNEVSKLLPDYQTINTSGGYIRIWDRDDLWKLIDFKSKITPGRTGKMGKYGGKGTHGKNKD